LLLLKSFRFSFILGRILILKSSSALFYINPDGTNNLFFTPEKSIDIQSLIADPKSVDIKDIKSLKELKIKVGFTVLIVIVLFLIVMLAIYIGKDIK
jgi:hypothetical protein